MAPFSHKAVGTEALSGTISRDMGMSSKRVRGDQTMKNEHRQSRGRVREKAMFPVPPATAALPAWYSETVQQIKAFLRGARVRAVLAANPVVIEAYWHIGNIIRMRQEDEGWGAKVIDRLATDLQKEFPDMGGLTARNLLSMKIFAREFSGTPIAKQSVSQLPWGHIIRLMQMVKDPDIQHNHSLRSNEGL